LFTNVPLSETIEICLDALFSSPTSLVIGLSRKYFKLLLELTVFNSFFIFNGSLYKQIEGLGMGLPLGPTFANIFMCFYEKIWLEKCPSNFRPIFYKRYIDDTFVLFKSEAHIEMFLQYLNTRHPNIRFTFESEHNNRLNFLDVCVFRSNNKFHTSVYRKPSFTNLGFSFFSFCSKRFKMNSLSTLITRAYRVCSDYKDLHTEFLFLTSFFIKNGFPSTVITRSISKFLSNIYDPNPINNQNKSYIYCVLPYFGFQSEKLKQELSKIISKFFPEISLRVILVNNRTIGSLFHFKDVLPLGMRSSLIYNFSCAHCASQYVGSTHRALFVRVAEHAGRSYRTGRILGSPSHSSIRQHCNSSCDQIIDFSKFKIVDSCSINFDLRILEPLYIHKLKPSLNDMQSAYPLKIVNR
jgi:hypothetical protein